MSYSQFKVKEIIEKIGHNDLYLPAIQRKFVWDTDQIESFFDSIMSGYPIGTFLFWFVRGKDKDDYTFYKFIQEWHQRDHSRNEIAPKPELKEEIIGVLDGQQRLGSMFVALQGSFAYKKPYARWDDDSAFPKRKFYLNLLKPEEMTENDNYTYEFKFLSDVEAKKTDKEHLWFPVREVLKWAKDPEVDDYYDSLFEKALVPDSMVEVVKLNKKLIKSLIRILHQRLVLEELISYYRIDETDLDKILDIFVRVNSGGTPLSKSDLLFSTIVANWPGARDEIETLLKTINAKGQGFFFNNDFIMRTCLVLTDSPVLFKVRSFKKDNIDKITGEWNTIKAAVEQTVDFLVEFGFNGQNLTSLNATIPIAYHISKGGNINVSDKRELRLYLIHSLLKQTFGGQGDQVLSDVRTAMRQKESDSPEYILKNKDFSLAELIRTADLPASKSLSIDSDDIEEILEYPKGSYTFMVLSLLYPNLRLGQVSFHQDHIHPASLFTYSQLQKMGLDPLKTEDWMNKKDQLPNLQLMEGMENEKKNKTPFFEWLHGRDDNGEPNVADTDKFMADNYIPKTVSLEFKNFEALFEQRKLILRDKLSKTLL